MPVTCRCGAEIQDDWKFCYACAGPLPTEEELAERAAAPAAVETGAPTAPGPAAGRSPEPRPQPAQRAAALRPLSGEVRRQARRPAAGVAEPEPAAHLLYAAILVLSTWCVGLGVGMVLPGPDGTDLPPALRLLVLLAGIALFAAAEAVSWPLVRLVGGRPPRWEEGLRSASARFRRLFPLRLAAVAGTFFVLLAAGLATL